MPALELAREAGGGFPNDRELMRITYDFDNDGGAVDDYTLLTADQDCIVKLAHVAVETAGASGGAMLMDLGKGAGGTEFLSDTAVASLTADALINADAVGSMVKLAATETIQMGIEGAALTAGKFHFTFEVYKF